MPLIHPLTPWKEPIGLELGLGFSPDSAISQLILGKSFHPSKPQNLPKGRSLFFASWSLLRMVWDTDLKMSLRTVECGCALLSYRECFPKKGGLPKDYSLYLGAGTIFHISKTNPALRKSSNQSSNKQTNKQNIYGTISCSTTGGPLPNSRSCVHTQCHSWGYSPINTESRVKALMVKPGQH